MLYKLIGGSWVYRKLVKTRIYRKAVSYHVAVRECNNELRLNFPIWKKLIVIFDMIRTRDRFGFSFSEYNAYHFFNCSKKERKQFVSNKEKESIVAKLNEPNNQMIFDDKFATYRKFEQYYKRDVIEIADTSDVARRIFGDFTKRHSRFIVKPRDGTWGRGIRIVDNLPAREGFDLIWDEYSSEGKSVAESMHGMRGFIAEELIVSTFELAEFHPESLNTVRINTLLCKDDSVKIVYPFLRLGRGDSCVDNAGSGGLICSIDADSGRVIAVADECGQHYEIHPDTKKRIVGFTIPQWRDAVNLANRLARVVKTNHYMAWDVALTNNGWVMVEGNARGQFVWQLPLQKGVRDEIALWLDLCGIR